jgi:hypothetical protein
MLRRLQHQWRCLTKKKPEPVSIDLAHRDRLARLLSFMTPKQVEGPKKRRYGSPFDGGYVMIDDFAGIHDALSLGIGGNVRWDLAMAKKGLKIWQYDYTVDGPPSMHPNFNFQKVRIGATEDDTVPTRSLATVVNRCPPGDLILKIDIEGAEWQVFSEVDADLLRRFRQILIEFHDFRNIADPQWANVAQRALEQLNRHHTSVHVHGNNFGSIVSAGDIWVTDGLEVSYVRNDAYRLVETHETFPGPYDRPNNPYRSDPQLGRFIFSS